MKCNVPARKKSCTFKYAVIHLPACPATQTHKFPKRHTNLFLHASIWTQKITIAITAYVFSSLDRASERMRHNQGSFPRATEKLCHISDKRASLQHQKQALISEEIGYYEEVFLLKR